jgi:hypothetical protein
MKKITMYSLIVVAMVTISSLSIHAQEADRSVISIKSKDVEKTRGGNPNIKVQVPKIDEKPLPAILPDVAGSFTVRFENATGFFVEVYLDGVYSGTVGAWGKLVVPADKAFDKVYCITTGGSRDWYAKGKQKDDVSFKLE